MNKEEVRAGISQVWRVAESLGIAEIYSNPIPLPVNEEFRDLILSDSANYIDVYNKALGLSHYNILLSDYSFFQFSIEGDSNVRYAFYPNPYSSNSNEYADWFRTRHEMVEAGFLTHEEFLSLLADKVGIGSVPLLRYENAPAQRTKLHHPCSHFHIGFHSENRWAVRRVLTPAAFALLVFKQYYGSNWRAVGDDEHDEIENSFDRILVSEKARSYLVSDLLFDPVEERAFYFG